MKLQERQEALLSYLEQQELPFETTSVSLGKIAGYRCSFSKSGKENDCPGIRGALKALKAKGFIEYNTDCGKYIITLVISKDKVEITALPVKSEKIIEFHPPTQIINDWELCDIDGFPYVSARFAARKLEYENTNDFIRIIEACISTEQITEDQFICSRDFTVRNRKVQTIDDRTFGRPIEKDYYLSEEGLVLAIMECRRPKSIEIKRQIAKVFVAWRHGKLGVGSSVSMTLRAVADIIDKHEETFGVIKQDILTLDERTDKIEKRVNILEKPGKYRDRNRRFSTVQEDIACQLAPFCHYCGEPFDAAVSELKQWMHHIKPWEEGGQTIFGNLAVIHGKCSKEIHVKCKKDFKQVLFQFRPIGFTEKANEKLEQYYAEKRKALRPADYVPYIPGLLSDVI